MLYEDYILLGSSMLDDDKVETKSTNSPKTEDIVKTIIGYVKKINPDDVTKVVTSIQKIMELFGLVGAGNTSKVISDPLFNNKLDDWF